MHHDDQKTVAGLRKLTVLKAKYGGHDYRSALWKNIDTLKLEQLTGLLLQLCLVGTLRTTPYFGADHSAELLATAKRYRINTAAIRKEICRQLKANAPKRSVQTRVKRART